MTKFNRESSPNAILAHEQEKSQKNLELATSESLLRIAEKLGFSETVQMAQLRDSFANENSDEKATNLSRQYIDLAYQEIDQTKVEESSLVFCILLIVLYSTRQTEKIRDAFEDVCDDALEIADNTDFPDLDRLEQLINKY
jgi:hypothetical protein